MNNETKDDIIAEMQRRKEMLEDAAFAAPLCYSTETMQAQSEILDEFIGRFEAANKRERCDCAKLREAIERIRSEAYECDQGGEYLGEGSDPGFDRIVKLCDAALATTSNPNTQED